MGRGSKLGIEGEQVLVFCAFMAICWDATMSEEIRTVGYDFEQILSTSVFSLSDQQAGCSRELRSRNYVAKATILFHESNTEIELRFRHYQASYRIQQIKNSNVYDDGLYLHQEWRILPRVCLLSVEICQSEGTGEDFKLPGFGKQEFKLSKAEMNMVITGRTAIKETFNCSALFMTRKGLKLALHILWSGLHLLDKQSLVLL